MSLIPRLVGGFKNDVVGRLREALWMRAARKIDRLPPKTVGPIRRVLIVASDPLEVVGSRGDDAMFSAVINAVREREPACEIGVVCVSSDLPAFLTAMGVVAEPIWSGHGYDQLLPLLERYDTLVMVGADVMDGHYSGPNALRQWAFSDLAARRGLRAFVLGCSFSDNIAPEVLRAARKISPKLQVFARERQSKAKFDRIAAHPATLVADSAFLLPPCETGPDHGDIHAWADAQRSKGRSVLAINVHPMIFKGNDMAEVAALNQRLADVISKLSKNFPLSVLLVAHDFREGNLGDGAALGPLHQLLQPLLGDAVRYAAAPARASEIKAIVAAADLLITGRMHLGVGALSMGVPMWGLSPQDKFIGLFEHFGLADQRITPEQAKDAALLEAFIAEAIISHVHIREKVRDALPHVRTIAGQNFSVLDR